MMTYYYDLLKWMNDKSDQNWYIMTNENNEKANDIIDNDIIIIEWRKLLMTVINPNDYDINVWSIIIDHYDYYYIVLVIVLL